MDFRVDIGELTNTINEYENIINTLEEQKENINKTIAELTEAGWSGEAKDKFMEKHIKDQEFYTNLIEDIKYVKNALENEEKPRAIRLKKQSEDFVNCIKRSGGGSALTNDDTGVISLQYGGQFQINNNVSECIDNYKKMNSKFEEILNLANSLSFTSFPIADDVLNLQNSLKNQTASLTEFNDSFNSYCNGVRDMEENICSVFSKISGITVGISEFRGISAISENGQVDKNKVMQLMLKNPNDLTNGEKELLSYVEKVLSKDEYAELKEQVIKEDNEEIADNLKLKFGDTSIYGPFLELANNDGFLKSIKKAGKDFIIGAGNSLDKNIFWGTIFTVGGINQSSMPKSIPYKIGELAGDIGSFAFGAAEAGTGVGGELLGFTADGTVVLAPAGVALNAASLGLVTHGGAATIKSAHNFGEDLFSLIKGEGNKGMAKADLDGVRIINKKYAGQTYKLSGDLAEKYPDGVKFTEEGFPDFKPYSTKTVTVDNLEGDAYYDFIKANEKAGFDSTPEGYTWHHVEDGKTMELVPSDLHGDIRHTGGASLIRKGIRPVK
ncbi:HNH endonuclease [Clostridium kluyveri]|uniref:HNH endonuclease n=1 Tax=Clostridium kluyveri TaxID=1534 RepID=UPI0022474F92|nr:HNH endonuclease [Clostridium kluyveri]UZQ52282.1 HNH endonuclease [Clostridium kluyveri]